MKTLYRMVNELGEVSPAFGASYESACDEARSACHESGLDITLEALPFGNDTWELACFLQSNRVRDHE